MAYVIPNSTVVLYAGVELDNTYNHTFYFADEREREDMFSTNSTALFKQTVVDVLDAQSYAIAKESGKIRATVNRMKMFGNNRSAFDVNYLRFKNTSYENKWFYAFVTDVEYLNEETVEFTYELDVMTTFYFDYELGTSFVEREHSYTDNVQDCLVPESLETGEYVFSKQNSLANITDYFSEVSKGLSLVLIANDTFLPSQPTTPVLRRYDGLPSSNLVYVMEHYADYDSVNDTWTYASSADLQNFYNTYINGYVSAGKTDALLGMFLYPTALLPNIISGYEEPNKVVQPRITRSNLFGTYNPFNNKLQTYPYKFVYVVDMSGNAGVYKFEYSKTWSYIQFALCGNVSTPIPSAVLIPFDYKNSSNNVDEAMTFSNFPQLSLVTDSFKQWLAENGTLAGLGGLKGVIGGGSVAGIALGSALTAATGAVGAVAGAASIGLSIMSTMAKFQQAEIKPNQSLTTGNTTVLNALNLNNFLAGVKEITPTMAECIDNYFSMFGYACHKTKTPARHNRERWTYTKTMGCVLSTPYSSGGVPQKYIKKIASIYDNGITFWVVTEKGNVGNYNQVRGVRTNFPLGGVG